MIHQLLVEPNCDESLEPEIAAQYTNNREEFDEKARALTEKFAS